ncbi:MAG: glycosyltransferase family 2 protein [Bacteroidales bacterium]|nr:glycosyltransferase family 2 protein [Bacteroidales bacterium]
MDNNLSIAVIILNWNGEKLLEEFLPKVIANTDSSLARVIVADNGSTDGSVKILKQDFPEVEVLLLDKNYGFAEGYNRAIAATGYPYTILLNSDVAPAPGWISPLLKYMQEHPKCGACQPKILSYKNSGQFEYAGASGGFLDKHGYPYCRGRIFDTCENDNGQYNTPMEVFWASGAALMVRTKIYKQAGGLDPEFFAHMEEIDLCWRMQLLGYKVAAVPQSAVYHLGGASLPADNPRKTYLNFRNNLLMMHKNLPDSTRKRKLFMRRLLDTAAWGMFLVKGQFAQAKAILKAHRDFAKMRAKYTLHPKEDILDTSTNLLLDYYFLHRNRFDQLRRWHKY